MAVFQRKSSSGSLASSSSGKPTPSRSNTASSFGNSKGIKTRKPSLAQRVTNTIKPTPKPQPSLLRRATTELSNFDSSRWEKRMAKRIEKFPKDHPLLCKIFGAGLCIIGAGASAATIPGLLAAIGVKLAVVNGTTMLAGTAVASGAVTQGAAVAGALTAGAKVLVSSIALDIGGKLLAGPPSPQSRGLGWFGRRQNSTSSSEGIQLRPTTSS